MDATYQGCRAGTRVAVGFVMPARFRTALLLLTLTLTGCGDTAPSDVREKIAAFYQGNDAERIAQIPPEDRPFNIETYMANRTALGRMIRTTEADALTMYGYYTAVMVTHNTEFERGHVLEIFQYRRDDTGLRLVAYNYQIGKRLWCPLIAMRSQCSVEDAPVTVTSTR